LHFVHGQIAWHLTMEYIFPGWFSW
jgi:hypothetical protein